jgi:hypothetical protein
MFSLQAILSAPSFFIASKRLYQGRTGNNNELTTERDREHIGTKEMEIIPCNKSY